MWFWFLSYSGVLHQLYQLTYQNLELTRDPEHKPTNESAPEFLMHRNGVR